MNTRRDQILLVVYIWTCAGSGQGFRKSERYRWWSHLCQLFAHSSHILPTFHTFGQNLRNLQTQNGVEARGRGCGSHQSQPGGGSCRSQAAHASVPVFPSHVQPHQGGHVTKHRSSPLHRSSPPSHLPIGGGVKTILSVLKPKA